VSFLSRLFSSNPSPSGGGKDVDAQLARLEVEAEEARPGYVGSAYNRAGDVALKAELADQAVGYYGRAIDAFLEDAQRELARGVANKIVRVRPTAIRTLCTLTWLDLAARHQATALLHLRDYTAAAKEASQSVRAATQIYAMARLSPDAQFVDAVGDALDGLAFGNRAKEVRGWSADGAPDALDDPEALSEACMSAALRSNDRDAILLSDDIEASEASGDDSAGAAEAVEAVEPEQTQESEDASELEGVPESGEPQESEEATEPEVPASGDASEAEEASEEEGSEQASDDEAVEGGQPQSEGHGKKGRRSKKGRKGKKNRR